MAERVSSRLNLKVGDSFVLTSSQRDRVSFQGKTMSGFDIVTRERVDVVTKSHKGYRFKVTLLALDVPVLLPLSLSADPDIKLFADMFKRHVTGTTYEIETNAKGAPVRLIDWRAQCRELAGKMMADLSSAGSQSARETAEAVWADMLAMDDRTAVKKLAKNFIVWAVQHNFDKPVGRPERLSKWIRPNPPSEVVSIEGDRVVIDYSEKLPAGKPANETEKSNSSRKSPLSLNERRKKRPALKDFAWEMEMKYEISLENGMAMNVLHRSKATTGKIVKEQAWIISVER
jgi:hypothetical protein